MYISALLFQVCDTSILSAQHSVDASVFGCECVGVCGGCMLIILKTCDRVTSVSAGMHSLSLLDLLSPT